MVKIASKLLFTLLLLLPQLNCASIYNLKDSKISIQIKVEEFKAYNDYNLIITVKNESNDSVSLAWSLSNMFVENENFPKLEICFFSSKTKTIYVLHDNANRIDFKHAYKILTLAPSAQYKEVIKIKSFFGTSVPQHDIIYVKYQNTRPEYDMKGVYTGDILSNWIKISPQN